jgi:hypothetical protein
VNAFRQRFIVVEQRADLRECRVRIFADQARDRTVIGILLRKHHDACLGCAELLAVLAVGQERKLARLCVCQRADTGDHSTAFTPEVQIEALGKVLQCQHAALRIAGRR